MRLMKRWKVVKKWYKFEKERLEKKWMMDRQRRVRLDRWKSRLIHRCSLKLQGWRVELSQLVSRIGKIEAVAAGNFVRKKWRLAKKVVGLSRGDFNRKKWREVLKGVQDQIEYRSARRKILLKKMEGEIVGYLSSGDNYLAYIRVEHWDRERNALDGHQMLNMYCQRVLERLYAIEELRACPYDLHTEIESLVYSASSCHDLSKLKKFKAIARKEFGRDFIHVASGPRVNGRVNRTIIQKLATPSLSREKKTENLKMIAKKYDIVWHATDTDDEEPEKHSSLGPSVGAPGMHDSPHEHWYINFKDVVDSFSDNPLLLQPQMQPSPPPQPPPPPPPPPPPSPPSPPLPRPVAAPGVHPKQPDCDEIDAYTDILKERFKNSLQLI